ncbi:unnamed protein product [Rhizophagus irregularis]|nr:unnamed protein product [Rhizophagus irregularis]
MTTTHTIKNTPSYDLISFDHHNKLNDRTVLHEALYILRRRLIKLKRREKNWLHRTKRRNKKKKSLPPLPPGTPRDPHVYYKNTYNINLFDYEVRRRYDVSSIPHITMAMPMLFNSITSTMTKFPLSWKMLRTNLRPTCITPYQKKDQEIINNLNIFLHRTPSPDNDSHTTMSDVSYISAAESVATIIYLPTLA